MEEIIRMWAEEIIRRQEELERQHRELERRILSAITGLAVALGVFSGIIITTLFKIWLSTT